jgi:hypothetical protein
MIKIKKIKTVLLAAMVTAVLCAGTVSARQLRTDAKGFASCGGGCDSTHPCRSGCLCIVLMETGNTFCSSHPIPGASLVK